LGYLGNDIHGSNGSLLEYNFSGYTSEDLGFGFPERLAAPREMKNTEQYEIQRQTDLLKMYMNLNQRPYYSFTHNAENHRGDSLGIWKISNHIVPFIETLDPKNSVIVLTADHGCYYGNNAKTMLGSIEAFNPMLIVLMPKKYFKESEIMRYNTQSLVTHWDLHKFLFEIASDTKIPNDIGNQSLNFFTEKISHCRLCSDVKMKHPSFCFCGEINTIKINDETKELVYDKALPIMNIKTGNGESICEKFTSENIEILGHTRKEIKGNVQDSIDFKFKESVAQWTAFFMNKELASDQRMGHDFDESTNVEMKFIIRRDQFSNETCSNQIPKSINPRWCHCKTIKK